MKFNFLIKKSQYPMSSEDFIAKNPQNDGKFYEK
ncbi:MAG: hypothetical protein ACI9CD_000257 [Candidatus Deianiraeaceae bacterium]|jgi:hypothetical protein